MWFNTKASWGHLSAVWVSTHKLHFMPCVIWLVKQVFTFFYSLTQFFEKTWVWTFLHMQATFVVLKPNDQAVCLLAALNMQTEAVWEDAGRVSGIRRCVHMLNAVTYSPRKKHAQKVGWILLIRWCLLKRSSSRAVPHCSVVYLASDKRQVKDNRGENKGWQQNPPERNKVTECGSQRGWKRASVRAKGWRVSNDVNFHHFLGQFLPVYIYSQLINETGKCNTINHTFCAVFIPMYAGK